MEEPPEQPLFQRDDWIPLGALFALTLGVELGAALLGLAGSPNSLSQLGVYFDGHLYVEIAKSFPLPYAPEGPAYLGQAPGFPALIYLARLLAFDSINWGLLALLCAWVPGALAALVFYLLCRQTAAPPFWGGALFLCANPIWLMRASTPHPEPLAGLLAMLCLLAYLRGRLGWSVVWLSLAALTRFPAILLGLPLAFGVLALRRSLDVRSLALLAVPPVVLGLYNLYLHLHIPAFPGIVEAHSFWWKTSWTWPFHAFVEQLGRWPRTGSRLALLGVTYASVLFYLGTAVLGFRDPEREYWILPLWVAVIVLFHASLSGAVAANDFGRLVILAWPAGLLILWRAIGPRVRVLPVATLCAGLLLFDLGFARGQIRAALRLQNARQPFLQETLRRLDTNAPHWESFHRGRTRGRDRVP